MRRGTLTLLFFIILLAIGSSFVVFWPHDDSGKTWHGLNNPFTITQGLDLQGGTRVLLAPKAGENPTQDAMQSALQVLQGRVAGGFGVKEPSLRLLTTDNKPSIEVDLPNFGGNEQDLINTLLKSGKLEFWNTGQGGELQTGTAFDPSQSSQDTPDKMQPLFTGKDVDVSKLGIAPDPNGGSTYVINFGMQGTAIQGLSTFTTAHVGYALTITLDRQVIMSANIQEPLPGNGQITGGFTQQQANDIVTTLKYGALPVSLQKISEETVSATLGQDAIHSSILAGIIGIAIVILFMLLYYRLPGFLADIALLLYALMTFAIFKIIGVTLTLAGIAGFILSIGMAVDANVLIFERVKEELRAGRLLASAIDIGWKRAWPSIRDSNCSTLITCAVLFGFGSNFGASIIVGFATTLFLGVVISMFTAIVVTRTLLNLLVPTGVINHPALFGLPSDAIPTASLARRNSVA